MILIKDALLPSAAKECFLFTPPSQHIESFEKKKYLLYKRFEIFMSYKYTITDACE